MRIRQNDGAATATRREKRVTTASLATDPIVFDNDVRISPSENRGFTNARPPRKHPTIVRSSYPSQRVFGRVPIRTFCSHDCRSGVRSCVVTVTQSTLDYPLCGRSAGYYAPRTCIQEPDSHLPIMTVTWVEVGRRLRSSLRFIFLSSGYWLISCHPMLIVKNIVPMV